MDTGKEAVPAGKGNGTERQSRWDWVWRDSSRT